MTQRHSRPLALWMVRTCTASASSGEVMVIESLLSSHQSRNEATSGWLRSLKVATASWKALMYAASCLRMLSGIMSLPMIRSTRAGRAMEGESATSCLMLLLGV